MRPSWNWVCQVLFQRKQKPCFLLARRAVNGSARPPASARGETVSHPVAQEGGSGVQTQLFWNKQPVTPAPLPPPLPSSLGQESDKQAGEGGGLFISQSSTGFQSSLRVVLASKLARGGAEAPHGRQRMGSCCHCSLFYTSWWLQSLEISPLLFSPCFL